MAKGLARLANNSEQRSSIESLVKKLDSMGVELVGGTSIGEDSDSTVLLDLTLNGSEIAVEPTGELSVLDTQFPDGGSINDAVLEKVLKDDGFLEESDNSSEKSESLSRLQKAMSMSEQEEDDGEEEDEIEIETLSNLTSEEGDELILEDEQDFRTFFESVFSDVGFSSIEFKSMGEDIPFKAILKAGNELVILSIFWQDGWNASVSDGDDVFTRNLDDFAIDSIDPLKVNPARVFPSNFVRKTIGN